MITLVIVAAIVLYAGFHLGHGHANFRHGRAPGPGPVGVLARRHARPVGQRPAARRVPRRPPPLT